MPRKVTSILVKADRINFLRQPSPHRCHPSLRGWLPRTLVNIDPCRKPHGITETGWLNSYNGIKLSKSVKAVFVPEIQTLYFKRDFIYRSIIKVCEMSKMSLNKLSYLEGNGSELCYFTRYTDGRCTWGQCIFASNVLKHGADVSNRRFQCIISIKT